ncbi:MAG: threonine/serine dehydratase [Pseudomonadota bacterium]
MSDIAMIHAAAERFASVGRVTPLLSSDFLDEIAGRRLLIKAECLQHTGSFKFRGGWSRLSALTEAERQRGVLAFSSGNHAQGVARAAKLLNSPAVIVMPEDAPRIKIENTRSYGAEIVTYDRESGDRDAIGGVIAAERGMTVVPPYDDPHVIAGQGTAGLEIAAQAKAAGVETADVAVCCGGGGLASGIALALAEEAPGLRVRTAEPERFDDMARSLAAGRPISNPSQSGSICDAIVTMTPGELTLPILANHAGPGLVVREEECLRAMGLAWQRLKIVLEPGGAAALAAALFQPESFDGDTVIAVATGGNVDPAIFARALATLEP